MDNRPNISCLLAVADGTLRPGRVFSAQDHPEAAPGPHAARYLFRDVVTLMKG